MIRSLISALGLALLGLLAFVPNSRAQFYLDVNNATGGSGVTNGSTTNWNTSSAFWTTTSAGTAATTTWVNGNAAVFSAGSDAGAAYTLSLRNAITVSGITTEDGAVTISTGGGGSFALSANATFTTNTDLSISSVIGGGAFTLTKQGAANLTLTGANTYTGLTTVSAGTLTLGNATNTLVGAVTVNGGTLSLGANSDSVGTVTLSSGNISGTTGLLTSNATFSLTNTGTISARLGGTVGLTKTGSGTVTLSGNNAYTGATTISGGTLLLGATGNATNTPLGTTGTGTTVQTNGALDLGGFTLAAAEALNITGTGVGATGALTNSGAAATYSGRVTLGNAASIGGTGNITLSNATAALAGNFLLTKSGSGNLIISTTSGTRTGGVKVDAGTLTLGHITAIGANTQTITLNGGTLVLASAAAFSTNPVSVTASSAIIADRSSAGPALAHSFGALTLGGSSTLSVTAGSNVTANTAYGLTFGATTLSTNATLDVANNGTGIGTVTLGALSGNFDLNKAGTGTLALNTASARTGGSTTLTAGTLSLGAVNALGTTGSTLTLNGGTLDLNTNASVNAYNTTVGGNVTVNSDKAAPAGAGITHTLGSLSIGTFTLNASPGANVNSGTAGLAFGATTLTGNATFNVANNASAAATLALGALNDGTSARTLTFSGNGTTTLGNAATSLVDGTAVNVTAGTLNSNNATALGSLANVTLSGGSTLNFNTASQTVGALNGVAGTTAAIAGTNTLTVGSATNNLSSTFGGTITGGGGGILTKAGSGTLTLTGTNTYSGGTNVNAGTLNFSALNNLGTGAISFGGGTLQWNTGNTADISARTVTLNAGGGTLDTNGNNVTLANAIGNSGTGALTKNSTGALTLGGANTYTGGTILNAGTLNLNNASALGTGAFTIAGGTTIDNTSGGITLSTNNAQNWNGNFTFTGTNNLNLGTGAVTMDASRQITTNANTLTVGGVIAGSGFSLTKAGSGALTLGGANTYTGGTNLNAGTLNINNASALGTGAFTIAGGTIDNTSGGAITLSTNNAQNWNGNFTFTGTNNLNLGTGAVTMDANRTVTANAGTLTVGGAIGGSGLSLTKAGAGTLVLGGANTYTGGTTLSAGTLTVNSGASLASTGALTVNAGTLNLNNTAQTVSSLTGSGGTIALGTNHNLTVNNSASDSYAGVFTGGATTTLTKSGTAGSTLTLSGNSAGFTGAINVSSGTLIAQGSANSLGGGTAGATVANNAMLSLQGGFTFNKGALTLTGTGVGGAGALNNISGNNRYGNHIDLGGDTTIGTQSGLLTLGGVSGGFTASGDTEPVFPANEGGFLTIGGRTLTLTGAGTGIVVESRIRDFAGQTSRTSYDFTAPSTLTLTGKPETSNPGNVIINMTGGGYVQYYAWANSYTGTTTVQQGELRLDTLSNTAAPHDAVTASFHSINGNLIIGNGDANAASVKLYSSETIAPGVNVTLFKDATLDLAGKSQTLGDTVNGVSTGGLTFTGGNITLGSGSLYLGNDVTVNSSPGNPVSITSNSTGSVSLTLNKDGVSDAALGNQTRTFTVGNGGNTYDLTIGAVVKTGSLVKAGTGVMMMNGTNTYLGTTNVTAGILNIQSGTSGSYSGLGSGDGTDALGTNVSSGATLQLQGGISITTEKLNLSGTGYSSLGALNSAGGNNIFGTAGITHLNLTDNSTITASAGTLSIPTNLGSTGNNKAVTFDTAASTTITVSGGINTGGATTSTVNKTGTGTLVLSGNSSYGGVTTVSQGILSLQHNDGLGAVSAGTEVASVAELQLSNVANGNLTVGGEALTISGNGFGGSQGALRNIAGNNQFGGMVTLAADSTIKSDANTLTLSGGISSSSRNLVINGAGNTTVSATINLDALSSGTRGNLTKSDGGELTFASGSALTGTVGKIDLTGGKINVGSGSTTTLNATEFDAAGGTTLTIASGGMVVVNQAINTTSAFSGAMAGAGEFKFTGADSTSVLAFNNSFSAPGLTLTLGGGKLSLLSGVHLEFGTIHITGNTILDFDNSSATWLTSAALVINAGVTVTVNNWISISGNTAASDIWYANSTINSGSLGGTDIVGGTPLSQIVFTNYSGLTTTWVSGNHDGWFNREIRPTPEPGTYGALLLSGCLGLIGWRRFRSRSKAAAVTKA